MVIAWLWTQKAPPVNGWMWIAPRNYPWLACDNVSYALYNCIVDYIIFRELFDPFLHIWSMARRTNSEHWVSLFTPLTDWVNWKCNEWGDGNSYFEIYLSFPSILSITDQFTGISVWRFDSMRFHPLGGCRKASWNGGWILQSISLFPYFISIANYSHLSSTGADARGKQLLRSSYSVW